MLAYPVTVQGRTFLPGGEIPPLRITRLNCGHAAVPEGITPGWYMDGYGYTWCKACAAVIEAAEFAASDAYLAYLTRTEVSTGAGTVLATVTSYRTSTHWTPTGGWYERYDIQARAGDGSRWHGRSSSGTCLITLRRSRNQGR